MTALRLRLCVGLVFALLLPACGTFSDDRGVFVDRRDDYIDAEEGKPIVVPEDLSGRALGDPFPIPPTPEQANAQFYPYEPPLPDAIYGDDKRESVRIQRLGDRRWLVVPESPATVWPKIKQFFAENGVPITTEVPEVGRLDSAWLTLTEKDYRDVIRSVLSDPKLVSDTQVPQRLLLKVEQGLQDRTSEIHLRQQSDRNSQAPAPTEIDGLSSVSAAAEQEMLNELGAYVAAKVAETSVSMVAQQISTQPKSVLERTAGGEPVLRLNLDFDRAWATVGQALTNAEVEVEAADEGSAFYRVVVDEQTFTGEKKGFFSRLFSFGSDAEVLQIKVLAVDDDDRAYRVGIEWPADRAQGRSERRSGKAGKVPRELAQDMLVLIKEYAG